MTISLLIDHYTVVKSTHAPMPASLTDKLTHLNRVYGAMPANSTGGSLSATAKSAWPHCAPGTVKRYLVQLKAVMNRAFLDGLIDRNPVIDTPYVNDTVYIDISTSELTTLLDYIKWTETQWYPLVLVLTQTGARLNEALALTEGSFTRHGTRISKRVDRRSKTIERVIPYSPRLAEAVATGAIFRNGSLLPKGIAVGSVPSCLGRVLDASTKAIGLPTMRVHDLRHAFAGMLAEKGADLADLTAALGHSSTAMSMRYRGLIKGRLNVIMSNI